VRILFLNQFFWPDAAPTGKLLGDLCEFLSSQGHEVEVLCGHSDYESHSDTPPPHATIHRIRNIAFSRSKFSRILSWGSFLALATLRSLRLPRYDLVVAMTTPPGLSYAGWLHQRLRGSAFRIWEMDLYPDVAVGTGVLSGTSLATKVLTSLMDWPRRRAGGIIALGECMRERLIARGIAPGRVQVAENWVDGARIGARPMTAGPPYTVLYSGNLGLAHDIETILGVMVALRDNPRFRFVFAGGGGNYLELKSLCRQRGLKDIEFLGYEPATRFAGRLESCHIGLVTLRPGCEGTVVPSKIYSLMAAGRPFLFIGPAAATPARHVRRFGCGWHRETGDVAGIQALLCSLADDPTVLCEAGDAARKAFTTYYERDLGVTRLARLLIQPAGEVAALP
jgi:colanic acid biosynthesis glycosyl transferase WcaI